MNLKTDAKNRNRLFSILGGLIGAIVGYFYPNLVQGLLPILGIGIGLFYFFATNSVNKNPDKKKVTDFTNYTWYSIMRFFTGLLVGSAIVSTIILTMDIWEQQQQNSRYFINMFL